jgi:hypothetical protein
VQPESDCVTDDAVFGAVLEAFDHTLDGPDDRAVGQAESEVHLAVRVFVVGLPGSAETVPDCFTEVGTEGEQARPQVRCEQAAQRSPRK